MNAAEFADRLGGRPSRGGFAACCPAHEDTNPSLSISEGADGRVLVHCHAGCSPRAVVERAGLSMRDLMGNGGLPPRSTPPARRQSATDHPGVTDLRSLYRNLWRDHGPPSGEWEYRNASGELVETVLRWETPEGPKPKEIRPAVLRDGRWYPEHMPAPRPLYRLPELLADPSRPVLLVEGEKAADAAREALGEAVAVTTWLGGSNATETADFSTLAGRRVRIWPDADEAGERAAEAAASRARTEGAVDVRVLKIDPAWQEAADAADLEAVEVRAVWDDPTRWSEAGLRSRTLADILASEGTDSTPVAIIPRLAYEGRAGLFAGREKDGKSTLLAAGIAAASRGLPFLGEPTRTASALWLTAEERPGDVARRLAEFGADPQRVRVLAPPFSDPLADLRAEVESLRPDTVVVDTLATLVRLLPRDERPSPGDSTAWTPVVMALADIAHELGAAVVIVGHARKSDGEYRDSTAIGAAVDLIMEIERGRTSSERRIKARGRWALEDFTVRLDVESSTFELTAGTLPLKARVYNYVLHDPGCSARELRSGVEGRSAEVDAARDELLAEGRIRDEGDDANGMRLWVCPGAGHTPHENE